MADSRPTELNAYIEAAVEKNDRLIVEALGILEDPVTRRKLRLTVASVCHLTKLSRNTVRNRPWALERLKELKRKSRATPADVAQAGNEPDGGAILDKLRCRVRRVLEQNALLYEEVLSLQRVIFEKDKIIETLKARKSASVTTLSRRVEIPTSESKQ